MKDFFFQRLNTWLWSMIVLLVVAMAVYSSLGRLLVSNVSRYQDEILQYVNARSSFELQIDELRGSWVSLTPRFEATGVRIVGDEHAPEALAFDRLLLELDVFDSIRRLSPQLYTLTVSGMRIHVDVLEDGSLRLAGMAQAGGAGFTTRLYDFVFNAEQMQLADIALTLHDERGARVSFAEAELRRDGAFRRINLALRAPGRQSWFRLIGEGHGELRDLQDFDGQFHLESSVGQLAFYDDLLGQADLQAENGALDSKLWLGITRGDVQLAAQLSGRDIHLKSIGDSPRRVAFDAIEATARADYAEGQWRFRARDVAVSGAEQGFAIDRLAGEYDGQRLELRLADLQLGTISRYLERAGLLPQTAADVLGKLSPDGILERVAMVLPDIADRSDWRLSANFNNVDVKPWKGAPGLTSAAGYASIGPTDGRVQLDSSDFSMAFPVIYHEPLHYQDFSAELAWQVHEDAFHVVSGPFTALGREGKVRGLFSLNLPRVATQAGAEMDLMVGLRDLEPYHRNKYLPYTLSENLLNWLEPSIGDGLIHEAGFIYRGSLAKKLPQHRTVHLFFDIENTQVNYHPQWPGLTELDGRIVIDNSNVDLLATKGRILDSAVRDIKVRLRPDSDEQLRLAVSAQMLGSAADGLAIVNQSALRDIVGDTFIDWRLDGALATEVQLQLNLSDNTEAPDVVVRADWSDVDVEMLSLNLSLQAVSGQLNYDSHTGFAAESINGSFWGKPFSGSVSQGREGDGLAELDIEVHSRIAVDALRDWLELEMLRFATGETAAELHVLLPPGGSARLEVLSDLQGVALDLPRPWGKAADATETLQLSMPLGESPQHVQVSLAEQAWLDIVLAEVGFSAGSLGFGAALPATEEGLFLLGGELSYLDWDEWSRFIDSYISPPGAESELAVLAAIRDLQLQSLLLFGQKFESVLLSGEQLAHGWHFDASTNWLRGSIDLPDDLSHIAIAVEDLDLVGFREQLSSLEPLQESDEDLPEISVTIDNLREAEQVWGKLGFNLQERQGNYHFLDISGELRGLQLGTEGGLQLDWLQEEAGPRTHLYGGVSFLDFGDVLTQYQVERVIQTNNGQAQLDLSWPGDPNAFDMATTTGSMQLAVGPGSFLKTSGATEGTLRVVGILNLADFVRRLSLDVSYAGKSGVPFESINGELKYGGGRVEVPHLDISGPSSRFQFVGVAEVEEATIDGELVVTLPIASNLPWIAALVSGLPAAAAVYVVSKVFTKQMDKFSSAVYEVKGPWADPEVNFQSIFDDTAEQKELKTADGPDAAAPAQVPDS
ncbi:MAG: DUF3971 domain-containing protein [Halieaceae bacterium]